MRYKKPKEQATMSSQPTGLIHMVLNKAVHLSLIMTLISFAGLNPLMGVFFSLCLLLSMCGVLCLLHYRNERMSQKLKALYGREARLRGIRFQRSMGQHKKITLLPQKGRDSTRLRHQQRERNN